MTLKSVLEDILHLAIFYTNIYKSALFMDLFLLKVYLDLYRILQVNYSKNGLL